MKSNTFLEIFTGFSWGLKYKIWLNAQKHGLESPFIFLHNEQGLENYALCKIC